MGWADTLDEARQVAALKKKPFAVYFATKEEAATLGETTETIRLYAAANKNEIPNSVFEFPKVIDQLRSLGVVEFVKIPNDDEHQALVAQLGGAKYTVAVYAPDGKRIGSWSIVGGNLSALMTQAKAALDAWREGAK